MGCYSFIDASKVLRENMITNKMQCNKDTWNAFSTVDLCVLIFPLVIGLTFSPTHCMNANFTVDMPSTSSFWKRERWKKSVPKQKQNLIIKTVAKNVLVKRSRNNAHFDFLVRLHY